MAGLVGVTPIAATHQGFQITSSSDMLAALQYISQGNYTGSINCQKPGGTTTYILSFTDTVQGINSTAKVGDWIIITNNTIAEVCPQAAFASLYTSP
jgi:hypothetical protein